MMMKDTRKNLKVPAWFHDAVRETAFCRALPMKVVTRELFELHSGMLKNSLNRLKFVHGDGNLK